MNVMKNIDENDVKLFPCYSISLMNFLTKERKIRYKLIGLNQNTKKTFYVFIDNEKLNKCINEWKEINKNS
jgi:hypothetical protein